MKIKYILFSVVLAAFSLLALPAHSQTITTYAGNGSSIYSGDGGAATAAGINMPHCVARDAAGDMYITEYGTARVRKVTPAGVISTYGGNGISGYGGDGGPATAGSFVDVACLTVDGTGNVFVADYHGYRVRKISATGIITTIAGNGVTGYSGDGGPATAAQISCPWGMWADASGNIYFSDRYNHRIRKINSAGTISTVVGNGIAGFSGDGGPATAAQVNEPLGICFDKMGNMLFSDSRNNRIRKVTPAGVVSTVAGTGAAGYTGDGSAATAATMNTPCGVITDTFNNFYFADEFNNAIRKVSASGKIYTIAGTGIAGYSGDGGPATAAMVSNPQGISVFGSGDIYFADVDNNRLRIIKAGATEVNAVNSHAVTPLVITPNPGSGECSVTLPTDIRAGAIITVTDVSGRIVRQIVTTHSAIQAVTIQQSPGIYYLMLTDGNTRYIGKYVKQN